MVIATIHERDLHGNSLQRTRCIQPAESTPDNHDMRP